MNSISLINFKPPPPLSGSFEIFVICIKDNLKFVMYFDGLAFLL